MLNHTEKSLAPTVNEQMNDQEPLKLLQETQLCGATLSVYGTPIEPLFLAKEVAEILDHSKASIMVDTVDEEEKLRETIFTSGQRREMWFLTEQGLYEVLMQSRKPIAREFKRGVKKLLKGIRTGELELVAGSQSLPSGMYIRRTARLMNKISTHMYELRRRYEELEKVSGLIRSEAHPEPIVGIEPILYRGKAWYPLKALLLATTEVEKPKTRMYKELYPEHTQTLYHVMHCDVLLARYILSREELRKAQIALIETTRF